jgi:hypothetical protein
MIPKEIRDICYKCGHRSLVHLTGRFPTDFCEASLMECEKVKTCDPSMRIPTVKETRKKRAIVKCFLDST